jgi:hypothetical protein
MSLTALVDFIGCAVLSLISIEDESGLVDAEFFLRYNMIDQRTTGRPVSHGDTWDRLGQSSISREVFCSLPLLSRHVSVFLWENPPVTSPLHKTEY